MQDDRERYLAEARAQADGVDEYIIHYLWIDRERKPWTVRLINCGMAIGNLVYMNYKALFRRVRPSIVCPGLTPPMGPPRHPAFPSGHSFLGHFIALLLLEIDEVAKLYGEDPTRSDTGGNLFLNGRPTWKSFNDGTELNGPLLWLAGRLATNRERIGVHYASDSSASRHLAAGVWDALFRRSPRPNNPNYTAANIDCPTLMQVLAMAQAEWKGTLKVS